MIHVKNYCQLSASPNKADERNAYTLTLNHGQIDKKQSLDMSQLVPAGGFDNFTIHFSCEEDKPVVVRLECEFLLPLSDLESERIFEDYSSLKKFEKYKSNYVSASFLDILNDYRQVVGEMEDWQE